MEHRTGHPINQAEFKLVASRIAQAAVLRAEKAGDGTVDLEAAKKKPTSNKDNDNGGNKPSGDGGTTPSGGGSSTDSGSEGDHKELD